jgi:hypothetical protein
MCTIERKSAIMNVFNSFLAAYRKWNKEQGERTRTLFSLRSTIFRQAECSELCGERIEADGTALVQLFSEGADLSFDLIG